MKIVLNVVVVSWMLLGFAACGGGAGSDANPTPAPAGESQPAKAAAGAAPKLHSIGETATYTSFPTGTKAQRPSWTVKVEEVKRSTANSAMLIARVSFAPGADCIVDGLSSCGVGARQLALVLPDGTKVLGSVFDISETPKLNSVSMQPGDSVSGWAGFAVPAGSGSLQLLYDPTMGQLAPQFGFTVSAD